MAGWSVHSRQVNCVARMACEAEYEEGHHLLVTQGYSPSSTTHVISILKNLPNRVVMLVTNSANNA